jgi:hypothetical protein
MAHSGLNTLGLIAQVAVAITAITSAALCGPDKHRALGRMTHWFG